MVPQFENCGTGVCPELLAGYRKVMKIGWTLAPTNEYQKGDMGAGESRQGARPDQPHQDSDAEEEIARQQLIG